MPSAASAIHLNSPLRQLSELPARTQKMLKAAQLTSVTDLITRFPRRYEDRRHFSGFPTGETDHAVCLHGRVVDCKLKTSGPGQRYVEVTIEDAQQTIFSSRVHLRWFRMNWLVKSFAVGQQLVVYGRVKSRPGRLIIDHPDYEIVDTHPGSLGVHMGRIVPIYPLGDGLKQEALREAIETVLDLLPAAEIPTIIPSAPPFDPAQLTRAQALRWIHFPPSLEKAEEARRYLALEECFIHQLIMLSRRQAYQKQTGTAHHAEGRLFDRWLSTLPFSLTHAQQRAIREIQADLQRVEPMNRLLQGDVGSGKTFVALAAALHVVESGSQVALMAPTQILAEQHFLHFQKHLEPLGLRVSLITANRRETSFLPLFHGGLDDSPQIIIGTHALLYETELFHRLGLVIIDEQHKFGVEQRARLVRQGIAPDVLVMTATPIPRTLALTFYGDLDVSVLDEKPTGRAKITTAVRAGVDLQQVAAFVRKHLTAGRQAYIIYPLVEESDRLQVKAVTTELEAWQQRLPHHRIGLLHGRLKPEEKERVMAEFRLGTTHVLLSTTVVEVGVDVPNANLILIFNAERFGLAQLHQLRGRVGRGAHPSYCILFGPEHQPDVLDRLRLLETTTDGFAIAEADLRLRGPGEILGSRQSGVPDLKVADLRADLDLIEQSRQLAQSLLSHDPELSQPAHQPLRTFLSAPTTAEPTTLQ